MNGSSHGQQTQGVDHLEGLLPLFRELNGLKRVRVAGKDGSWAERLFVRAWARLVAGEDIGQVAREETASAVGGDFIGRNRRGGARRRRGPGGERA